MEAARAEVAAARAAAERAASAAAEAAAAASAAHTGAPTVQGPPLPRLRTRTALLFPAFRPPSQAGGGGEEVGGPGQTAAPALPPHRPSTLCTPSVSGHLEAMDALDLLSERVALWGEG